MSEDALLLAVLEAPDDDGPRLAYAELLRSRGEVGRADFIEVQCALAGAAVHTEERAELEGRERELLRAHGAAWLASMGLDAGAVQINCQSAPITSDDAGLRYHRGGLVGFRRGFVEAAKLEFLQYSGRLARCAPLRQLVLTHAFPAHAGFLERFPAPPSLKGLTFRASPLGAVGVSALATSPSLQRLEELSLHHCGVDDAAVQALAARGALPELKVLDVSRGDLGTRAAEAIVAATWTPGLRTLILDGSYMGDDAVWVLGRSNRWESLQELSLGSCCAKEAGTSALASRDALRTLTRLRLRWNDIGAAGARSLATTRKLPHLGWLDVAYCRLDSASLAALRRRYGAGLVEE